VALLLFVTIAGGGLAAMAQWALKNRRAEITLYVVLLAASFMAAGVGVLSGLGLVAAAASGSVGGFDAALYVGAGLCSIGGGLAVVYLSLRQILRLQRGLESPERGSDPPRLLALWLIALVFPYNVSGLLAYTATPEELGPVLANASGLSLGGVLLSQLPLLVVAVVGVGLFVNRSPREVLDRLGYGSLSVRQLGAAGAFGVGAYTLSVLADRLFAVLQPGLYRRVGSIPENVASLPDTSLILSVLVGVLVSVALALGEESLWRGAAQPVFGIFLTALVATSFGSQFGLSPVLLYLLIFSLGLGVLRRRVNTTASFLAHTIFFLLVILGALVSG
jgi:uncharacterized protein